MNTDTTTELHQALSQAPGHGLHGHPDLPPGATAWLIDALGQCWHWAILAVVLAVDVVLIKPAMTVLLANGSALGWFAAIGLALLAVLLMRTAGTQAHEAHLWSRTPTMAALLALAFLLVAGAVTWIRWHTGDLTSTTVSFEGTALVSENSLHHTLALTLLPIMLGTGFLAFLDGWARPTSALRRYRAARSQLATWRERLTDLEATVVHATLLLENHQRELATIDDQSERHRDSTRALAAEARAHARRRIYLALGDPAAAGITDPSAQRS